jgi:zinc protease
MRILSALLLSLVLSAPAWAKTEKVQEAKLPNGLVVHEYRMANGMQLLLVPEHSAPVFTYQVWFKVGSAVEKMDPKLQRTGLAHLFEHMMFRGTPKNPDQVFDQKLSAAGAVGMNATTWLDRTNYFQSLPKERLELVFELESDRMANLVINEQLFKTELGAVFGELKMRNDKPTAVAYEKLWDLAFDKSPYKWPVIGTEEELKSFTVDDAMYFYKTYYAPNNATLILLGDFQIPAALRLAEKYYGKMVAQEIPQAEMPVDPEQKRARTRTLTHPLANSEILMMGFKIPGILDNDLPALDVVAGVLAYGNGSWLEQELVQEGIASTVYAYPSRTRQPGLFTLSAQMAPGKSAGEALKVIRSALARIRDGKVSAAELERAKNQYLLYAYGELLSLSNVGRNLGEALASSDNYLRNFEILERVKKVTISDLQRVAKAYLTDARSSRLTVTPGKGN